MSFNEMKSSVIFLEWNEIFVTLENLEMRQSRDEATRLNVWRTWYVRPKTRLHKSDVS